MVLLKISRKTMTTNMTTTNEENRRIMIDNADKMKSIVYFFTQEKSTVSLDFIINFIFDKYKIDVISIFNRLNDLKEEPFSSKEEYRILLSKMDDADKIKALSYFFTIQGQLSDNVSETDTNRLNSIVNKHKIDVGGIISKMDE